MRWFKFQKVTFLLIFGVIGIFLSLVMFWFLISFGFVLIASLIDTSYFKFENVFYVLGLILFIRIFYPRYIFQNK